MKRSFLPKLNLAPRARNMDKAGWRIAMCCRRPIIILLATVALFVAASPVQAQSQYLTPDGAGDITFTPGLRLQSRYTYDDENGNHDFFIRRTRLKAKGEAFDIARYYAEIKIDSVGRFENDPKAQVENAWLDFTVIPELALRV